MQRPNMTVSQSKILVLYTGGTIGCLNTERGLTVQPGFLSDWLRSQSAFNDPNAGTVASHAHSQAVYNAWLGSEQLPDRGKEHEEEEQGVLTGFETPDERTLITPVFRFGGEMKKIRYTIRETSFKHLAISSADQSLYSTSTSTSMSTSTSHTKTSDDPLVGSSSIDPAAWMRIANDIRNSAGHFDGFVVLHGTDTMAYTASALAFLLADLPKPVVLTGAQIPLCEYSSDATNNFRGALLSAGMKDLPEVCIFFNRKLMRGCRTRKVSSFEVDAFDSPLMKPLLIADVEHSYQRPDAPSDSKSVLMNAVAAMSSQVIILHIWPGMTTRQLKLMLSDPETKGVVMYTYGAGNFPIVQEMLDVLKEAIKQGLIVVNVSQCARGKVLPLYITGVVLNEIGVVAGNDMTPECAFVKLSYLLAQDHLSLEAKKRWLGMSMVGEMASVAT